MKQYKRELLRYIILILLLGIGIWQIRAGNTSFGSGLLGGAIGVFIVSTMKQMSIRKAQAQGMNPVDERTWTVAGMAAYTSYVTYALILAGIVLLGSIWGPKILVNPYNLLGICLSGIVFLYVGFYYYYNQKL
jgi:multisubunit Na+/H+ antiporter MnhE subunit